MVAECEVCGGEIVAGEPVTVAATFDAFMVGYLRNQRIFHEACATISLQLRIPAEEVA